MKYILLLFTLIGCSSYNEQRTTNRRTQPGAIYQACVTVGTYEEKVLLVCPFWHWAWSIPKGDERPPKQPHRTCTVSDEGRVSCPDGTTYQIPIPKDGENGRDGESVQGPKGDPGDPGERGQAGTSASCTVTSNVVSCSDGTSYTIPSGADGRDGSSCSVARIDADRVRVTCTDGTSATVEDGQDGDTVVGPQGNPGANGQDAVLEVIYPCGSAAGYHEILLRLADRRLVAVFDGGPHQDRLVIVPAGHYRTTDGYSCNFEVTAELEVRAE